MKFQMMGLGGNTLGGYDSSRFAGFKNFGAPSQLMSDNDAKLRSKELLQFLASYGVRVVPSVPYLSNSNASAENRIKAFKQIIARNKWESNWFLPTILAKITNLLNFSTNNKFNQKPTDLLFSYTMNYPEFSIGKENQKSFSKIVTDNLVNSDTWKNIRQDNLKKRSEMHQKIIDNTDDDPNNKFVYCQFLDRPKVYKPGILVGRTTNNCAIIKDLENGNIKIRSYSDVLYRKQ